MDGKHTLLIGMVSCWLEGKEENWKEGDGNSNFKTNTRIYYGGKIKSKYPLITKMSPHLTTPGLLRESATCKSLDTCSIAMKLKYPVGRGQGCWQTSYNQAQHSRGSSKGTGHPAQSSWGEDPLESRWNHQAVWRAFTGAQGQEALVSSGAAELLRR